MGTGAQTESNRLWGWMAAAAFVVVALFVLDPFGGDSTAPEGLPLDDGGVPFIAVIETQRAPSRTATIDEPAEVLDMVVEAQTESSVEVEAEAMTKSGTSRGTRTTTADG